MDTPPFFKETFSLFEKIPHAYRPWLSSIVAALAGLGTLVVYFQSGPKASAYAQAEGVVEKWEASPENEDHFRDMVRALRKVPSLEAKYDAVIAQKLINGGKGADALGLAQRSLLRAKDEAPYHSAFAETTLLIEQAHYQEALEMAVGLKEQMVRECDVARFSGENLVGGAFLYVHNLLRIACLQQELKNGPGEKAAWEELETFLSSSQESPVTELLMSSFQEKGVDLSSYIAERKKHL
jgi:hypothetical protein